MVYFNYVIYFVATYYIVIMHVIYGRWNLGGSESHFLFCPNNDNDVYLQHYVNDYIIISSPPWLLKVETQLKA